MLYSWSEVTNSCWLSSVADEDPELDESLEVLPIYSIAESSDKVLFTLFSISWHVRRFIVLLGFLFRSVISCRQPKL